MQRKASVGSRVLSLVISVSLAFSLAWVVPIAGLTSSYADEPLDAAYDAPSVADGEDAKALPEDDSDEGDAAASADEADDLALEDSEDTDQVEPSDGQADGDSATAEESTAGEPLSSDDPEVSDDDAIESLSEDDAIESLSDEPSIIYSAHVQGIGWQDPVADGDIAGTSGQSRRVEGLTIELQNISGGVTYAAHVQRIGWQDPVSDGAMAGTTGQSLRLEALSVSLTGEAAEAYDVYYRVHCQRLGWLNWAKNGEYAGSQDYSYRMEAVQIQLVKKGDPAPEGTGKAYVQKVFKYYYHVQRVGWESGSSQNITDEIVLGTMGQSNRLEAFEVTLAQVGMAGGITYSAHVQGIGWQGDMSQGETAGTEGQSKRIEAVKFSLTGDFAAAYDIYYQAHIAGVGWLGWAKNGEPAGSEGLSCRMEAVRFKLVPKGTEVAATGKVAFVTKPDISLSAYVRSNGWQAAVAQGKTAGTTGKSLPVEAIQAQLVSDIAGGIEYRTHVSSVGWTSWVADGAASGAPDQGKRVEAVAFRLTGDAATYYDVYYRAYIQRYGWMDWAKNGEAAGSSGISYRLEAVQVVLRAKGTGAPGSTEKPWTNEPYLDMQMKMYIAAQNYASSTNYLVLVDTTNNYLGVFEWDGESWEYVKFWRCSTGAPATPTVLGQYTVTGKGYSFGSGFTCYYYTQFYGDYLIHSVTYYQGTHDIMEGAMGVNISHGCVRLLIENAKWIYDNIPYYTKVVTYR